MKNGSWQNGLFGVSYKSCSCSTNFIIEKSDGMSEIWDTSSVGRALDF